MKTFIVLISLYPLITRACLITGFSFTSDISALTDNLTDCVEDTFPKLSMIFGKGKNAQTLNILNLPEGSTKVSRPNLIEEVTFLLYTPESNGDFETLKFFNSTSLAESHFDLNRPTRFITHGYIESSAGEACILMREAYLKHTNSNVIVIDWGKLACDFYPIAVHYAQQVGEHVGEMISFLENEGMNPDTTTLVGHSLGAHIMGIASNLATKKIKYLIGLDPAMPCFLQVSPYKRISPDDAKFVQVIHTSVLGNIQQLGDYDFYPNGGKNQPGCACKFITESVCSHKASFRYFVESLDKKNPPFYAVLCESFENFKAGKCSKHETIMGGIENIPKQKGRYYLYTKAESPYSFVKLDWINELNMTFNNHTKNMTSHIMQEINNLKKIIELIHNDLKRPILTKLAFFKENIRMLKESLVLNNITNITLNKVVNFRLYTPETIGTYEILEVNNSESLNRSHFNTKRPTRFITHGYMTNGDEPSCSLIRDAYLNRSDCNVIVVDWRLMSNEFYIIARLLVEPIGKHVGAMISFLEKNGMDPNTTTLVGHSLGAHIMGIAGKNAAQKVGHAVGLDPAMPLFFRVTHEHRIAKGDAGFVEIIHTDAGLLGFAASLGDCDFYPNGGSSQPGCGDTEVDEAECSHSRSFEYFAESIINPSNPFYSLHCNEYEAFKGNHCEQYDTIMGGIDNIPKRSGRYYLNTATKSPYSLGKSYGKPECSPGKILNFFKNIISRISGDYIC